MQPLAEATAEKSVPTNSSTMQRRAAGQPGGVEERRRRLSQILPRHQAGADVPGERRGDQQRDHAGHRAERQRAAGERTSSAACDVPSMPR